MWLVDEKAETVEVRSQAGDNFDDGRVFACGERVVSGVFPTLDLHVDKLFTD